jgi:peptidoglycan/LPS O-acetylase OafA/YrhL
VVAVLRVLHEDGRTSLTASVLPIVDRVLVYVSVPFLFIGFLVIPRYVFESVFSLLCALLLARVVLAPATGPPSGLVRLLERRPIVAAGKASYSVFLWNAPVCVFLLLHGVALRGVSAWYLPVNLAIVVPVVAMLSAITYLGIERPAMRLRRAPRLAAEKASRPAVAPVTPA